MDEHLDMDYREYKLATPIRPNSVKEKPFPSVEFLAFLGLLVSLVMILVKTFSSIERVPDIKLNLELIPLHVIVESGEAAVSKSWSLIVEFRRTLQAIAVGLLVTYCTWMFVFLDSHIPGVFPPSPLSPPRGSSGVSIHSGYAFTLILGVIAGSYMYYKDLFG